MKNEKYKDLFVIFYNRNHHVELYFRIISILHFVRLKDIIKQ